MLFTISVSLSIYRLSGSSTKVLLLFGCIKEEDQEVHNLSSFASFGTLFCLVVCAIANKLMCNF